MSYYENKVAVVTGGSEVLARRWLNCSCGKVLKWQPAAAITTNFITCKTHCAGKPLFIKTTDVSRENECQSFIEETIKTYGQIDILINNAGISMRALFADTDMETMHRLMDVNFWGAVYCTKYALDSVLKRREILLVYRLSQAFAVCLDAVVIRLQSLR